MAQGYEFPKWQADCLNELLSLDAVSLELVILDASNGPNESGFMQRLRELKEYGQTAGFKNALNKLSWYLYKQPFKDAQCYETVDLSSRLQSISEIECQVEEEGFSQYFHDDDFDAINDFDLDFILRFGFGIIRGDILNLPRYGVWSFHHNDIRKYRGGPPCFWGIYNSDEVTGAVLQRLTDDLDSGIILRQGFFPTDLGSYRRNLDNVFLATADWPAQVALDILHGEAEYFEQPPIETNAPILRAPSPLQILRYNYVRFSNTVDKLGSGISEWNVGVVDSEEKSPLTLHSPLDIEWLENLGTDGYIADPFPMGDTEHPIVFVEEYSYAEEKGEISYVDLSKPKNKQNLETALSADHHLSYPYVFEYGDEYYATPEMSEAEEVVLYKINSPDHWERVTTLVPHESAIDPTVIRYDDMWWLFFTTKGYPQLSLHIWHSEDLCGDWVPHANNPVKEDARSARPAGSPLKVGGELLRPAQFSGSEYGKHIVINKIEKLSEEGFSETKMHQIEPSEQSPYPRGMHTISFNNNVMLVDGKRKVRNKHWLRKGLRHGV